jgi:DNA polymerase-3 subunit gamma/tau
MDNFIVSARKYRPATFDMVVGQQSITSTLKNAIRNNQLAQAFLFCGPRGVGKTTCARILAKTINCLNPIDKVEACDKCESCLSFNRSASFNIHELDAASNNSVEDIRNLVDQVRIPPQVGKYKVYIIDEVHMLSASAFNAFLKTLEEPPAYAKFILATTEKHKIIPTILSRCQIFDFKRIVVKDIADYLAFVAKSEGVDAEEEALHVIAQKADGAMRDALSFFDQLVSFSGNKLTYETVTEHLNILDSAYYFRIIDQVLAQDSSGLLLSINEIINRGFDGQHFLIGLGEHLRNLMVCQDPKTVILMEISANLQQKYLEQAKRCSSPFLLKALDIHNQFDQSYKTSNNKRLQLELALLQICTASVGANPATGEKKNTLIHPDGTVGSQQSAVSSQQSAGGSQQSAVGGQQSAVSGQQSAVGGQQSAVGSQQSAVSSRQSAVGGQGAGSGTRTISIRPENHVPKAKQNEEVKTAENVSHQDFTQEKLEKVWLYYTESIAGQYPNFYSILSTRKPLLKEDFNIELQLDNKAQELTMKERRADLLDFLRTELRNQKIQMETILVESATQSKPYTAEEKYRTMLEKNPELKSLREGLELELEL